ncbi:META domain-containing protein [Corynebacterium variabile]|uniref:META domain-containing protein n=1 Tax=Corynebacterium variabile TaxID=1727 RepID=UPI0028ED0501|nr:META domain-containing protein [Corynebacterium variabile]
MNRRVLTALPAVALAVSLAACSDSDDDAADTSEPSSTSAAPETSAAPTTPAKSDTDEPGDDTTEDPMTMPGHPYIRIIPGTGDAYTGSWRDPDGGAIINFADDGSLTGTDGCNNFQSTWTLDSGSGGKGSVATVEPFPTTMMACTGPWSPWIVSMHEVRHEGDHLSVTNEGGTELGELIPAVPA